MVSLMVTAIIILVPPELSGSGAAERIGSLHSLPEKERELLASYLEMKAMYPDSLEFHVRLASLYYRNSMEEDLLLELQQIRILDPDHSILLLEEDLSVAMEDLIIEPDSTFADSVPVIDTVEVTSPVAEDTVTQDTVVLLPDSATLDLRPVSSDSIIVPVDSILSIDSSMTEILIEEDSLSLPALEDSVPETVIPDSVVTEETSTVVSEDSTESTGGVEYGEPVEAIEDTLPSETLPSETHLPEEQPEPEGI